MAGGDDGIAAAQKLAQRSAKLQRQLSGAQQHLKGCTDPATRVLMQKNIAAKELELKRLQQGPEQEVAQGEAPASEPTGSSSGTSNCCADGTTTGGWWPLWHSPRPAPRPKALGSRDREASSHEIAEPFVMWQLLLAVVGEVAVLALLLVAATKRAQLPALGAALLLTAGLLRRDRCAALRCHRWAFVRWQFQAASILHFAWRLDRACAQLPPPVDAVGLFAGGARVLDEILASGPDTYQKKPTNRIQIES
jgi:hypothetical protein